ncbi:MAG: VWA domain-containing protein, partial [Pseudomonadales bacterium]
MIEFAAPWAFLLLPIPALVYWLSRPHREAQNSLLLPFFNTLAKFSNTPPGSGAVVPKRSWILNAWQTLAWCLLIVAACGPQKIGEPIERNKSARDLMVAVDLSGSMQTKDFYLTADTSNKVDRLSAIKSVLHEFAEQREHDRLGLIVFGDAAFLQTPFTEDHSAWRSLLDDTAIGMAGQSTVFGDAIGLAIKLFERSESLSRVLIVLTDGNDTGSKVPPVDAAKVAQQKGVTIYTIAIGDPATIGEEAMDTIVLQRVAELTGGKYYQALDREQLLTAYRAITDLEPELYETLSYRPRHSLFHWPLAVVCIG